MKLRLTPAALADIAEIDDYLSPQSPIGARNVQFAIDKTLQVIVQFPYSGRKQQRRAVRKIATSKYPYLIYYRVDAEMDEVIVMAIQHSSRRRKFEDA